MCVFVCICKINSMLTLNFRNFFLTQFEDSENLEQTGILEMDLSRLAINDLSKRVPGICAITERFLSVFHSQFIELRFDAGVCIGGFRGGGFPPDGPISFIFIQFSRKNWPNNRLRCVYTDRSVSYAISDSD